MQHDHILCDPCSGPIIGPHGHNLNKLGRGPLGDATYHIKALVLVVSDKNILSYFPYISLCKTCDPWGGAIFGFKSII